jgi:hypothetical protein
MESDPEFQIKPDDAEMSDLWKKSQAIVDKTFYQRDKFAPHELIQMDAAVRLRAINEPILRSKLAKVQAELDDYKARVNGKEESRGGSTRRTAPQTKTDEPEDWQKDLTEKLKNAA